MTIDEAKFDLHEKLQSIKKLLKQRHIELSKANKPIVTLNGFSDPKGFRSHILYGNFRDMVDKIEYAHMCELDEAKQKKLARYIIMQLSFKEFRNHINYENVFSQLNAKQKRLLAELQINQENLRQELIQILKEEYLRNSPEVFNDFSKLKWKGNQKQLAELFGNLIIKGWITNPIEGEQTQFATSLVKCFDLKHTTTKGETTMIENLRQHLKPTSSSHKNITFNNCVKASGAFYPIKQNDK